MTSTSTIAAVAAEIHALVNSKPRSPTTGEIEALLKAWLWSDNGAAHWGEFVAAYDAACIKSRALESSNMRTWFAGSRRVVLLFAAAFCLLQHGFIAKVD
jgi:hypothetical protein